MVRAMREFDLSSFDEPFEKSTNFDIGFKFKRDFFGWADHNIYHFKFQGADSYYFVYEQSKAMTGVFRFGDNNKKSNKGYDTRRLKEGYNMYAQSKTITNRSVIIFIFPTLEYKNKFYKKWQSEYEIYK